MNTGKEFVIGVIGFSALFWGIEQIYYSDTNSAAHKVATGTEIPVTPSSKDVLPNNHIAKSAKGSANNVATNINQTTTQQASISKSKPKETLTTTHTNIAATAKQTPVVLMPTKNHPGLSPKLLNGTITADKHNDPHNLNTTSNSQNTNIDTTIAVKTNNNAPINAAYKDPNNATYNDPNNAAYNNPHNAAYNDPSNPTYNAAPPHTNTRLGMPTNNHHGTPTTHNGTLLPPRPMNKAPSYDLRPQYRNHPRQDYDRVQPPTTNYPPNYRNNPEYRYQYRPTSPY